MPTEKLFWLDPFATTFDVTGARIAAYEDKASVVLDKTVFYAEAGGQLADTGALELDGQPFAVSDVQVDDDGVIHHLVDGAGAARLSLSSSTAVKGRIEPARRRDHMAQHTAQHMLSRALLDEARAETVSSRLGANVCTIDVSRATIPDAELARAEAAVNAAIQSDVVVRAFFPSESELKALPLRRAPKVATGIRIIDIDGFDVSPCGGTHCTRTGQVGLVRIVGTEKYKGMTRVTFHAANRALDDMRSKERALSDLARELTCGALDVGNAVAKLRADMKARLDALSAVRGELVAFLSAQALAAHPPDASGTTRVVVVRTADDIGMLRALAARIASRPDVVAFCASAGEPGAAGERDLMVVVQRGSATTFDCGGWFKTAATTVGGRGGGRPERAEGKLPENTSLSVLVHGESAKTAG